MAKLSQAGAAEMMELGCLCMNVTFDLFLNTECILVLTEWEKILACTGK